MLRFTAIANHQAIKIDNFDWVYDPPPVVCNPQSELKEGFGNFTTFPDSCWTASAGYPNFYLNDTATDKEVVFYSMTSPNTPFYITTPELSNIDSNHVLKFKAKPSGVPGNIKVQIGTLALNDDYNTFVAHGNEIVIKGGAEQEYTSIVIPANSTYKYLSLKIEASADHQVLLLDDFLWEEAPEENNINENITNDYAVIYPNPAKELLVVATKQPISTIQIYDFTGKLINQMNVSGTKADISVNTLANGMYMIHIQTANGNVLSAKFMKQ